MMRNIVIGLSMLLGACSAGGPQYQQQVQDLKNIDYAMNVSDFYRSARAERNLKLVSGQQYVAVFELSDGWTAFQVKKFSTKDVVAKFNNVNFSVMNAIADRNGKLKVINAETDMTATALHELYQQLDSSFGQPLRKDTVSYTKYHCAYRYTWEGKQQVFQLFSIFNPEHPESLDEINAKIPDPDLRIVNDKPTSSLFICEKSELNSVLALKLSEGNWSKFN